MAVPARFGCLVAAILLQAAIARKHSDIDALGLSQTTVEKWERDLDVSEEGASDLEEQRKTANKEKIPFCDEIKEQFEKDRAASICTWRMTPAQIYAPSSKYVKSSDPLEALTANRFNRTQHPSYFTTKNFTWLPPFADKFQSSSYCGEACNTNVPIWVQKEGVKAKASGGHSWKTDHELRSYKFNDMFLPEMMTDEYEFTEYEYYKVRDPYFWFQDVEDASLLRNMRQRAVGMEMIQIMERTEYNLLAAAVMDEARTKSQTKEAKAQLKKDKEMTWFTQSNMNFMYMRAYGSALSSFGGTLYDQTNMLEQYEEMKSYKNFSGKMSEDEIDGMLSNWLGRQYTGNWNAWMWLSTNLMFRAIASGNIGGCVSRGCKPKPKPPKLESVTQLFKNGGVEGFVAMDQEDGYNNGFITASHLVKKLTTLRGLDNLKALVTEERLLQTLFHMDFAHEGRLFFPQYVGALAILVFASIESGSHTKEGELDGTLDWEEISLGLTRLGVSITDSEAKYVFDMVMKYPWPGESQEIHDKKQSLGVKEFFLYMQLIYDPAVSRPVFEHQRNLAWGKLQESAAARVLDYGGWHLIIGCMYDYVASYHDLVEAYMAKDADAVKDAWATMVGSISNYGMWTNNALGIIKVGSPGAYEAEEELYKNSMQWVPPPEFIKKYKEGKVAKSAPTPKYLNGMKYVPHSDLVPVGCGMYCAKDEERRKANAFVSTPWTYLHMLPTLPIYMGDMTLWDHKEPNQSFWPSNMGEQILYKRLLALRWMTWGLTVMHIANVREFYLDWMFYTKFPDEGSIDERDNKHIYRLWTSFQLLWYQTWLKGGESDYMGMKLQSKKATKFTSNGLRRGTGLLSVPKKARNAPQVNMQQVKVGASPAGVNKLPNLASAPTAQAPTATSFFQPSTKPPVDSQRTESGVAVSDEALRQYTNAAAPSAAVTTPNQTPPKLEADSRNTGSNSAAPVAASLSAAATPSNQLPTLPQQSVSNPAAPAVAPVPQTAAVATPPQGTPPQPVAQAAASAMPQPSDMASQQFFNHLLAAGQGAPTQLPQQALSPLATDPVKVSTAPWTAEMASTTTAPSGVAQPVMLEVPDFNVEVTKMIAANTTTASKLMSPDLKYEWQFWRMGLRYMASWHTIISCSYDLASNIRMVQLYAQFLAVLTANFGTEQKQAREAKAQYSAAQNNLLISLTNFGTWVSYHIPTVLIGYPAQVRQYAEYHGRKGLPRSRERAILWTYMWSTIYYTIGTQIMWTPTPYLGKEYKKHLGKETVDGKKLSLKQSGIVADTPLDMKAEGNVFGPLWKPMLSTKMFAHSSTTGLKCTGGEAFGKVGDFAEMNPYDVIAGIHEFNYNGEHKLRISMNVTNRQKKAIEWMYRGGFDVAKPPVCTHSVPEDVVKAYIEHMLAKMMPPPTSWKQLPPWAPSYKEEVSNWMNDLWMTPRESNIEKYIDDPSEAPAPIVNYPSAVIEASYAAAMQPLGTGFISMNPISTNMFPSITEPVALIK